MAITLNTIQALTPTSRSDAGVYGLFTNSGNTTNTTSALFGQKPQASGALSETQKQTLSQLEEYVKENVSGPQADAIMQDIAGLSQLYTYGNSSASFSALSQLLGNSSSFSNLTGGSLINQLV